MDLAKLQKVGPLENYKPEELMKEFDGEIMAEFVEKEMSAITAEDKATKVERLRLSVAFNFLLSVDGDSSEEARGGSTHSNVVRFESLVAHPDEVDWRIQEWK
ncbi:hypothetical protein PHYSODRAFT_532270 [Phytophthora sojae]|uniref:Uncharacterized protein n=1 Tax=Phytophthora sojae (strain P6497) TaxID=1094619 RepID=G5AED6_PHYSP|nr:hypothetical protein PHYSODRAFT_532270 [Phytophthora sojae]EGZ06538.1 hypothetical protein PHYSODRAFT_532270 [Phytophthora sojae]|eukprot:XP_009538435.1 hypothetical protein PHYSODRAFT_532270 [Phytophthora sojae]